MSMYSTFQAQEKSDLILSPAHLVVMLGLRNVIKKLR